MGDAVNTELIEKLIAAGAASGGSELANYQLFIVGLSEALGLERPNMASEQNHLNDYVFERRVDFKHPDGSTTAGDTATGAAASSSKPSSRVSVRVPRSMPTRCC